MKKWGEANVQSVRFLDSFLVKMLEEEGMVKWENYALERRKRYMIKKRGCSRTEKQFLQAGNCRSAENRGACPG